MTLGERIKAVRKALGLTQREFGERISIKQNSVAQIEMGRNTSDQTIQSICREYNVSEAWLRRGDGEMFLAKPSSALAALAAEYDLSGADRVLVEKFLELKPETRRAMVAFLRSAVEEMAAEEEEASRPLTAEEEARAEAEEYYRQLLLEKRAAAGSSASSGPGEKKQA